MNLKETDRDRLRKEIISRIEAEFSPNVIARWVGIGNPADDFKDDTERFEAYMVEGYDLERFVHLVRQLRKEIGKPNGFSIMVHPLDPENTTNFRLKEYEAERAKRPAVVSSTSRTTDQQRTEFPKLLSALRPKRRRMFDLRRRKTIEFQYIIKCHESEFTKLKAHYLETIEAQWDKKKLKDNGKTSPLKPEEAKVA